MLPIATRIAWGTAAAAFLTLAAAPLANAYPAGPWGVEGPCRGLAPHECPATPSGDGLTWTYAGRALHYDKLGVLVCATSADKPLENIVCEGAMLLVRAVPPTPFGQLLGPQS